MKLKVYADRMSQPSRAVLIFCKYPTDLFRRAKVNSVLDWHHSNLRHGTVGLPLNPQAAAEAEKLVSASLAKTESFWLKGNGPFLVESFQPSVADLILVCEIMQLEVVDEKDRDRIFSPYKKVLKWIDDTRNATQPHFDDMHAILFRVKEKLQKQRAAGRIGEAEIGQRGALNSKI